QASKLLREDTDEIVDVDILEKYLPSFTHLSVPFIVESETAMDSWSDSFSLTTRTADEIRQLIQTVDRSLVF
ncbi:MAG: hypothetical protein K8R65_08995, partial [Nitrospirae bacterium]|nr:hypothetical protein [Nitrospirota bacterium]